MVNEETVPKGISLFAEEGKEADGGGNRLYEGGN